MLKRANILKKKNILESELSGIFQIYTSCSKFLQIKGFFFFNFVQGFTQDESRLQIAHYYTVHKYTSNPKYMYLQNSMEFRARVLEFISLLNIQPYF